MAEGVSRLGAQVIQLGDLSAQVIQLFAFQMNFILFLRGFQCYTSHCYWKSASPSMWLLWDHKAPRTCLQMEPKALNLSQPPKTQNRKKISSNSPQNRKNQQANRSRWRHHHLRPPNGIHYRWTSLLTRHPQQDLPESDLPTPYKLVRLPKPVDTLESI